MGTTCMSVCFCIFVVLSLLLYLGEVILNGIFIYDVFFDQNFKGWFTVLIGLFLLPMVTVQLVSAVLLLQKRGDNLTTCQAVCVAVLHVFQLGFLWRHFSLLREKDPAWRKKDLGDFSLLQLFYTFSSMLPILLIQAYILISYNGTNWLTLAATLMNLVATAWSLAAFRRLHENEEIDNIVLTWPGTIFRLLWRSGEIVCRVISLAVFATVFHYWIFLVLALHWVTIMICIMTSVLGIMEYPGISRGCNFLLSIIVAYIYIFCYINFSPNASTFKYFTYYIIVFLENVVLTVAWYIYLDHSSDGTRVDTIIFISACSFCMGILSLAIYYRFFHIRTSELSSSQKDSVCVQDGCINCRLSLCSKHNIKLQRPFSAGWMSQYQQALVHGNYYKNILQDSLIDSMSEWEKESTSEDSVSERGEVKESSNQRRDSTTKEYTSVQSSGTYKHKRFFDKGKEIEDSDSSSMLSIENAEMRSFQSEESDSSSQLSDLIAFSSGSSRTHLLTESWDNLLKDSSKDFQPGCKNLDLVKSLIRKDMDSLRDSSWFSDGYTTDHTLDSYELPITVLAKKRQHMRRSTPSVTSDSTDCTICAFIRNDALSTAAALTKRPAVKVKDRNTEQKERSHSMPEPLYSTVNKVRKADISATSNSDSGHSSYQQKSGYSNSNSKSKSERYLKVHSKKPQVSSAYYSDSGDSAFGRERKYSNSKSERYLKANNKKLNMSSSCNSDSGDSAFPRETPVGSYLAITDEDGSSQSSLEMII